MTRSVFALLCGFALLAVVYGKNKLLLLSFDGFRYDYLDRGLTPTFKSLLDGGSTSRILIPNYPSLTFPSHYTMATGRHSEHHGIVGNTFYDPVLDDVFDMGRTAQEWWYYNKTEPIWITAKKQGLKVGCYFWPGSETTFVIDGKSYAPDYWKKYDAGVPWKTRVDTVVDWFKNQAVDFATLYTNEPDSVGHSNGPDSSQVNTKLASLDTDLSYLITQLTSAGVRSTLDIIIVSDHGMYNWQKVLTLGGNFGIPASYYTCWQYGAHMQLDATSDSNRAFIYNALKGSKDLQVFYKSETPSRLHYDSSNPRISEILVLPNIGVYMRPGTSNSTGNKATHGWDNAASQMGAIMIANGPSFKTKYVLSNNVNQVDLYPLMTSLLGITGQANDGTFSAISPVLKTSKRKFFRGSP